jgi:hypothetical protein
MPRALDARMIPQASSLVELGMPALAVLVTVSVVVAVFKTSPRRAAIGFAVGVALWLAFTGMLAAAGFFERFDAVPPRLLLLLLPTLGLPLVLGLSRIGSALAAGVPLALLVLFHAYRFPLELVMHRAAAEGTMPLQMSFTGLNFDIVSGVTALVVGGLALFGRAPRWLLLAWNALGSLLLAAIVVIAVASLPQFQAFGPEPSRVNTWVAYFPFVWLPAGLVTAALLGHVILWRRLLAHGMRGRALEPLS